MVYFVSVCSLLVSVLARKCILWMVLLRVEPLLRNDREISKYNRDISSQV
jgi:hypothetical protein